MPGMQLLLCCHYARACVCHICQSIAAIRGLWSVFLGSGSGSIVRFHGSLFLRYSRSLCLHLHPSRHRKTCSLRVLVLRLWFNISEYLTKTKHQRPGKKTESELRTHPTNPKVPFDHPCPCLR